MGVVAISGILEGTGMNLGASISSQDVISRVSLDSIPLPGDETGLIQQAQSGDKDAFASLIERYWDRLYRWLHHLTRDVHSAEDLTQETFMKAFAALKSFRAGSNFRAWLFRIGHNNFVNQRRSMRHNKQSLPLEIEEGSGGPVEETLTKEAMQLLHEAVAKLPIDFRSALLLRAEKGLSFREVAEIMGITEQTARWRVFKARQKLMNILNPELLPNTAPPEPNQS
jgi:RNA polymerase sigma-70 factor, ECF subfamily